MDESDLAATLGGFSPATGGTPSGSAGLSRPGGPLQRTVSEEVQHALGASLGYAGSNVAGTSSAGRNGGGAGYSTFDPMDHARLSPSAFDPSTFSRQFTLPKFASGGPSDPFGLGVGVTDPPSGCVYFSPPSPPPPPRKAVRHTAHRINVNRSAGRVFRHSRTTMTLKFQTRPRGPRIRRNLRHSTRLPRMLTALSRPMPWTLLCNLTRRRGNRSSGRSRHPTPRRRPPRPSRQPRALPTRQPCRRR